MHEMKESTGDWVQNVFEGWDLSGRVLSFMKDIYLIILFLFLISIPISVIKRFLIKTSTSRGSSPSQQWWEETQI